MKKVAIVGAGAAGLCAAKHFLSASKGIKLLPVVFEQRSCVGGTWVYEDVDKNNLKNVYSSMYVNLRTNLPKQIMCFPDFEFPEEEPSYMHHTSVNKYLQDYADHFKLLEHIKFNTKVTHISPIMTDEDRFVQWNVSSVTSDQSFSEVYDAVVVCNGHYSIPAYPKITYFDRFPGEVLHSHYYREPSRFKGKTVLIQGDGPSGIDIMLELAAVCHIVYFSHHNNSVASVLPSNVIEQPDINYVNIDGEFVFENEETARVDTFIPCTGYCYDLPFLDSSSHVVVDETCRIVKNIYKHLFSIRYPSLSFIGIPWQNAPLPIFHQQCNYVCSILTGIKQLPTEEDMFCDTENERLERLNEGQPSRYFHRSGPRQFTYNNELAELSGCSKNPPVFENLYRYAQSLRKADVVNYKNAKYVKLNEVEFLHKHHV